MKAEQLYYTSCEKGLENASGFQIKAMSSGFNKINDVRQLGSYEPSRDLPSQPDEEELKIFPILFKYKDNVFVRSVYVGQDYTQRFGNYFMHTLEVDKIDLYPIDLYFWAGWVNNEKKVESLNLNSIEINKINPQLFTLDNKELLSKLISALFLKDKQIVIKISNQIDGIKLLNFMQKAFPLNIAKNITFSTYQFSYNDCLDINLVIGDTEWEHIDQSEFYFFDLTQNLYPEINNDNKYPDFIVNLLDNSTRLEQFYSFFNFFNSHKLDSNLDFIVELFLFIESNRRINSLEGVLSFVSSYLKREYINDFLKYLEPLNNSRVINESEALLSLYIDIFSNTVFININKILTNFLNKSLQGDYPFSKFESFMIKINQQNSNFEKDFAKSFLKQIEKDKININENEFYFLIKKLKDYINITQDSSLSYGDFHNIILSHIQQKKKIDFEVITLFEIQQQRDLIAKMSNTLLNDELIRFVQFFISYYKDENYFITVKFLMDREEVPNDFKVFLFKEKLKTINNRVDFFDNYRLKVGNYPEIYYNFLNKEEKISQIKAWNETIKEYEKYPFFNDIWQQINESLFNSFMNNDIVFDLYHEKYDYIKFKKVNKFLIRKSIFDYEIIDKNLLNQIKKLEEEDYEVFLSNLFYKLDKNKIKGTHFQFLVHPKYRRLFFNFFEKEKFAHIIEFYLEGLGSIEVEVEKILIKIISKLDKKNLSILENVRLNPLEKEKLNKLLEKAKKQSNMNIITRFISNFMRKG